MYYNQELGLCIEFGPVRVDSVRRGGGIKSSLRRFTPSWTSTRVICDCLLPFVHPLLSQVFSASPQEWPQTTQFTWCSVAVRPKPRKNRWFLKCLGFKNGRKMQKNWKDFVGKGFFGVWRLLNGTKRRYLHGFARLPGTKPCRLRWFWAVYASKWPQNTVNTSGFMCL